MVVPLPGLTLSVISDIKSNIYILKIIISILIHVMKTFPWNLMSGYLNSGQLQLISPHRQLYLYSAHLCPQCLHPMI